MFFANSLLQIAKFQKDTNWNALAFYRKAVINHYSDNQEAVFRNAFKSHQHYAKQRKITGQEKFCQNLRWWRAETAVNLYVKSFSNTSDTGKLRNKNRNYVLIFFTVILLGLTIFILYYFREKHRKEKIRGIYNTETRISKVIHDELANDVYNVMGSMEAIAPTETMDKLEQIYSLTRNISRENSQITTGKGIFRSLDSIVIVYLFRWNKVNY